MLVYLLAATLTFPVALERAIEARGAQAHYEQQAKTLESFSFRGLPSVRAETGVSSADDLNLLTHNVTRFDAYTALITVDYPLFHRDFAQSAARADAQLLRRRADDEADEIFRETLDAFARLYTAGARLELLRATIDRAAMLRERSQTMLQAGLISNNVAAQWEDQALAAEATLVDLELQRLDADTRLKQLIGDTSEQPLEVCIVSCGAAGSQPAESNAGGLRARRSTGDGDEERKRIALQEALSLRKPQVMMSAFGGVANVTDGTFGLYGVRVTLSLPMFDGAVARRIAQARIEADDAARARTLAEKSEQNRAELLRMAMGAADKRIALLAQAAGVARQREESVTRLVRAGVRTENDLVDATAEIARREGDLLAVRVERWKLEQQLRWER
jgi:outer membrane protein TolC